MSENRELRIISAAILYDGSIYLDTAHRHIRKRIARIHQIDDPYTVEGTEGFVTDKRVFLRRTIALAFGLAAKIIPLNSDSIKRGELSSDDIRPILKRRGRRPIAQKK